MYELTLTHDGEPIATLDLNNVGNEQAILDFVLDNLLAHIFPAA